jgi:hypothetical protein
MKHLLIFSILFFSFYFFANWYSYMQEYEEECELAYIQIIDADVHYYSNLYKGIEGFRSTEIQYDFLDYRFRDTIVSYTLPVVSQLIEHKFNNFEQLEIDSSYTFLICRKYKLKNIFGEQRENRKHTSTEYILVNYPRHDFIN